MKKFFTDLLSGTSDTSSKRFASLLALFVVISLAYIATYKNEEFREKINNHSGLAHTGSKF